ncbi:MAG: tryptophan synthase subunit alpha [Gammaproteobacteria bacterium]
MSGINRITDAIAKAKTEGRPALVAFMTGGFPTREAFQGNLESLTTNADIVEIGVPFTDPMADGVTIQKSSQVALAQGVTLSWILEEISRREWDAPVLLMSYLNPLLAMGDKLAPRCEAAGVAGIICPDLPLDESEVLKPNLDKHGIALVNLVTPVTTDERMKQLCETASGFVYAVTVTGTTGGAKSGGPAGNAKPVTSDVIEYLKRIMSVSKVPVCAGFGIRSPQQVTELGAHADGVIVGSALVEQLADGNDPGEFLRYLKGEK